MIHLFINVRRHVLYVVSSFDTLQYFDSFGKQGIMLTRKSWSHPQNVFYFSMLRHIIINAVVPEKDLACKVTGSLLHIVTGNLNDPF
jgi:hypothetical protein